MDFNPTCFAHPKAADGFALAHGDKGIRDFRIEHTKRCRKIVADIGRALGSTCVTNVWISDGYKDRPVDRVAPRKRLIESLDAIFAEKLPEKDEIDAVECKLFGIGSVSYIAGSHEFCLGYAVSRQKAVFLGAGHFHPTETLADKISPVLLFVPRLLLHVSRGVRCDSDHVVVLGDPRRAVTEELVIGDFLGRTSIGFDCFDASINRVGAWVIGIRTTQKTLLLALLEPMKQLREAEAHDNLTARLALREETRFLPGGAVWDEFCRRHRVPVGTAWLSEAEAYGQQTTRLRS